ncbi:hypothetical protein QJS66_17810 [Kocuria rhizophila]|nr:hypothetical protein QJS66_17810 [Kocuria rhizophila]
MTLGDRVAVLKRGRLTVSPSRALRTAGQPVVAGFIGAPSMNFIPARIEGGTFRTPIGDVEDSGASPGRLCSCRARAAGAAPERTLEDAKFVDEAKVGHGTMLNAEFTHTEWLGNQQYGYIHYQQDDTVQRKLNELAQELDTDDARAGGRVPGCVLRVRGGSNSKIWLGRPPRARLRPGDGQTSRATPAGAEPPARPTEEAPKSGDRAGPAARRGRHGLQRCRGSGQGADGGSAAPHADPRLTRQRRCPHEERPVPAGDRPSRAPDDGAPPPSSAGAAHGVRFVAVVVVVVVRGRGAGQRGSFAAAGQAGGVARSPAPRDEPPPHERDRRRHEGRRARSAAGDRTARRRAGASAAADLGRRGPPEVHVLAPLSRAISCRVRASHTVPSRDRRSARPRDRWGRPLVRPCAASGGSACHGDHLGTRPFRGRNPAAGRQHVAGREDHRCRAGSRSRPRLRERHSAQASAGGGRHRRSVRSWPRPAHERQWWARGQHHRP